MPVLKEKPVLLPRKPCGGCDVCGECIETKLYAFCTTDEKHRCRDCFVKWAQAWPMKKNWIAKIGRRSDEERQ